MSYRIIGTHKNYTLRDQSSQVDRCMEAKKLKILLSLNPNQHKKSKDLVLLSLAIVELEKPLY